MSRSWLHHVVVLEPSFYVGVLVTGRVLLGTPFSGKGRSSQ
ncbi:hypothetical protein LINGRAHAP2_LOCUS7984 [Linum grandiflorum]